MDKIEKQKKMGKTAKSSSSNKKNLTCSIVRKTKVDSNRTKQIRDKLPERMKYLNIMERLLNLFDKAKVKKIINQVKIVNLAFHEYLNHKQISHLKYEHILEFELMTNKQQTQLLISMEEVKNENKLEQIRIGFQTLKEKMEEFEITEFINEVDYAQSAIERESAKLQKIGQQYKGINYLRKSSNIVKQIREDEMENGPCSEIERNILKKTDILERAERAIFAAVFPQTNNY